MNSCYEAPASHRSSHLEHQLRAGYARGLQSRLGLAGSKYVAYLVQTRHRLYTPHGRPDPMGPSNLFPNVFEHCEMASQVPKRVIVVFSGRGIQISVLQNLTFLFVGLGMDPEQVGQLRE